MDKYDLSLFDVPMPGAGNRTLREHLIAMGNKWFDVEKCITGENGRMLLEFNANRRAFAEDTAPEIFEYWQKLGMKKTVHSGEKPGYDWVSYTPVSAFLPENAERKYPLIIFTNAVDVHESESYGIIQEAAKREYIVVVLREVNDEAYVAGVPAMAAELLPVDRSRIYATGFSYGSGRAELLALKHPELLAAYAPTGCHMIGDENFITEAELAHAREVGMPTCLISGHYESTQEFPLTRDIYEYHKPGEVRPYTIRDERGVLYCNFPKTGEEKVERLRRRLWAMRCRDVTFEMCKAAGSSGDPVSEAIGAPFDKTELKVMYGVNVYIGDYTDSDGNDKLRVICIDHMPHYLTPPVGPLMLDFFDRFSRDPESGKIVQRKG